MGPKIRVGGRAGPGIVSNICSYPLADLRPGAGRAPGDPAQRDRGPRRPRPSWPNGPGRSPRARPGSCRWLPPWPACSPTAGCGGGPPSWSPAGPLAVATARGRGSSAWPWPWWRRPRRPVRGARSSASTASGRWPPTTSASTSTGWPWSPGPGCLGRGHRGGDRRRRPGGALPPFPPARPWPAGWWPGPVNAGRCWWCSRAGRMARAPRPAPGGRPTSAGTASGTGEGYLRRRRMTVTATGRRSSDRPRRCDLWLPTATGAVAGDDRRPRRWP